jgi:NitT/TauT family transport system ATP-binding protein
MTNTPFLAQPSFVSLSNVSKSFSSDHSDHSSSQVLSDFSLHFPEGELTAIFGPNGCGKSTILNLIAGLELPDTGTVTVGKKPAGVVPVGYVFQDFRRTTFPWKRAIDNIAYPLVLEGQSWREARGKAMELLQQFRIDLPTFSYPYQLSGGEQQLVALFRALIYRPSVLLLDEPFSALDYRTRLYMQEKVAAIWNETKTTMVFVSHELDEAVCLADRVVILSSRPARVVGIVNVDIPRPRTMAAMETASFQRIRTECVRHFRQGLDA